MNQLAVFKVKKLLETLRHLPITNAIDITDRPVSSVVMTLPSVQKVWGLIPGPGKSVQCRRLATVATFLQSSVALVLSRGEGLRHLLHASAQYCGYNEDLI